MAVLERILGIILPIFIMVCIGYIYARRRGHPARGEMATLNRISLEVLCPLLIFTALAGKEFDLAGNGLLILAGGVISLGSGLVAWPIARLCGYDARTFLPPMIYNNCGNMGFPLALLAFGPSGMPGMIALFMVCTLTFFTIGIIILESGRRCEHASFFNFLKSPIMISMLVGLSFSVVKLQVPLPLFTAMKLLGEACIPLMLFSLGIRMLDVSFKCWKIGLVGAIVCPLASLAIAGMLDGLLLLTIQQRGLMYMFASLPPAVFCFIMAEHYQQEPDNVAAIVLLGNIASLLFVPLGLWLGLRGG